LAWSIGIARRDADSVATCCRDPTTPHDDGQVAEGTQWRRKEGAMSDERLDRTAMLAVYTEVSNNYRAIDELRLKLLALLPLATGTGILVFLGREGGRPGAGVSAAVAVPVGLFGMVATVSLYFYELHGVEKCAHFIHRGDLIERQLGVRGSFRNRPHHIFGVVSELLPTMIIYPASLASWLFVALSPVGQQWFGVDARAVIAGAGAVIAVAASVATILTMERTRAARREAQQRRDDLPYTTVPWTGDQPEQPETAQAPVASPS
jgi:hypothetical protein